MKIWNKSIKSLKKIITKPLSTVFDFGCKAQAFAQKAGAIALQASPTVVIGLLEKAKIFKDKSSSNPAFSFYLRTRYTLQKQSAAYSSPIRVICKLFIVYIFGSFCWLAYNTSKYSRVAFSDQKHHRFKRESLVTLLQDIVSEISNLPLLKNTGDPYTAETVDNILFKEKEQSALTNSLINKATVNGTNVNVKLSPLWQEFSTQNYVGKDSTLTGLLAASNRGEVVFFARKPLLLKNYLQEENILLNKDRILLKDQYLYSGTSLVIGPESDLLPRKLESVASKSFERSKNFLRSKNSKNNESSRVKVFAKKGKSIHQLAPTPELVWAEDLQTKLTLYPDYLPKNPDLLIPTNCLAVLQSKDCEAKKLQGKKEVKKEFLLSETNLQLEPIAIEALPEIKPLQNTLFETLNHQEQTSVTSKDNTYADSLLEKTVFEDESKFPLDSVRADLINENLVANKPYLEEETLKNSETTKRKLSSKRKYKNQKEARSNNNSYTDFFYEPRLQSGFNYPDTPLLKNSQTGVASYVAKAVQIQKELPRKALNYIVPTASTSRSPLKVISKDTSEVYNKSIHATKILFNRKQAGSDSSSSSVKAVMSHCREDRPFLEFVYQPNHLQGYISYKNPEGLIAFRRNSIVSRLPIRTPTQFVALDKTTDIATTNCLLEKPNSSRSFNLVQDFFSQNKTDLRRVVDAPESFFGGGWLQLGERFTIEKLQGNQQIGVLYNIHTGDPYLQSNPVRELASPYSSTGTSLRTVFGKIKAQKPGVNFTKTLKTKKLITNYRTVTNWAVTAPSTESWLDKVLMNGIISQNIENIGRNKHSETDTLAQTLKQKGERTFEKLVSNQSQTKELANQTTSFFRRLFYFNRVEGKTDSNLESPFQYYNPNPKAEGMSEETLFRIDEYEKSILFPQIHAFRRGIAFNSLPIKVKQYKEYTDQDIEIQSILGGMRQRTESESTAEMHPNAEQSKVNQDTASFAAVALQDEKDSKAKEEIKDISNAKEFNGVEQNDLPVENEEQNNTVASFALQDAKEQDTQGELVLPLPEQQTGSNKLSQQKKSNGFSVLPNQRKQKKKFRSTDYYPLRTFFTVSPQESIPQFSLGPTDLGEYNYIGIADTNSGGRLLSGFASNIKGNVYTKGFYLERINGLPRYSWTSLSKLVFFVYGWYGYKILATALNKSTRLLPVGFTDAIGLQTVQEKYRIIRQSKTKKSFRDLAGAEKTLSELRDLIWTFRLGTGEYSRKGLHIPYLGSQAGQRRSCVTSKTRNRFLLVGPPGTGKTLLVKALAAEANVPVIVQPASQLRMISGVENPVSALFHLARQVKPCIIFLDELDTLGSAIDTVTTGSTSEQAKAIRLARKYTYTLLLELDGLTSSTNDLLVIGATNRPETLNPALTRAGRFDTVINCNLPSQEQRLSVLSLYLNQHNIVPVETAFPVTKQRANGFLKNTVTSAYATNGFLRSLLAKDTKQKLLKSITPQQNLKKGALVLRNNTASKIVDNTSYLSAYLAQRCYGLSQASIATVVNESALDSMLHRGRPVHTLETLERAIESVKILTAKLTNYSPFPPYAAPDSQKQALLQSKNQLLVLLAKQKQNKKQKKQEQGCLCNLYPKSLATTQQFLVFTAYETAGSLLFLQKRPSLENQSVSVSNLKSNQSDLFGNSHNITPINRKDFKITLLQTYAGKAAASIYTSIRPQIFKLSATSGLYTNPIDIGTNIFHITTLTGLLIPDVQSKQLPACALACFLLGKKQLLRKNSAKGKKTFTFNGESYLTNGKERTKRKEPLSKQEIRQPQFVSETSITKERVYNPSSHNSNSALISKNTGFNLKNSLQAGKNNTLQLPLPVVISQHKGQQQLSNILLTKSTVKLSNPLTTRWFRVYLYRPFFRYDSPESIENKEYYPINAYSSISSKTRQSYFRNVSTRRLVKLAVQNKNNSHRMTLSSATVQTSPETQQYHGITGKGYLQKQNHCTTVSQESVYLAVVASTFHTASVLVQKHRELLDYCVYKTLRYGVLYEFSFNELCKKF